MYKKNIALKSLIILILTLATSCNNNNIIKNRIKENVILELEKFVNSTSKYWLEYISNSNLVYSDEAKEFLKKEIISGHKNLYNQEAISIIDNLNLSKIESVNLLKCLETSNNQMSAKCENLISLIMHPFSLKAEVLSAEAYNNAISELLKKPTLITIETDKNICNKYRTGKFHFIEQITNDTVRINRLDKTQIEISKNQRKEFKINWISNCEYQIKQNDQSDSISTIQIIGEVENGYRYINRGLVNSKLVYIDLGIMKKIE